MELITSIKSAVFISLRTHGRGAGIGRRVRRRLRLLWLIGVLGISGCGSERLLSVRFEQDHVNSEPNIDQEIGRCREGLFGTVRVVRFASSNMIRLTQAEQAGSPPATLRCAFPVFRGEGRYLFTMRMFIPTGSAASILFQDAGANPTDFFRVDFPKTGLLHAPGSTATAGRFPHDKIFSVAVNLHIGSSSTVEVTLLGKAHGSFTADVADNLEFIARNFSAVQIQTGARDPGSSFVADDLLVVFNP